MGTVQKLNRLEEITREEQEEGAERLRRMGRTNIGNTIEDVMTNIPINSDYYTKEQIDELLNDYVRKVEGKGLSTEDYTSSEKAAVNTISNKADKVTSATAGNFAGLDGNGNLIDSGKKPSDFATPSNVAAEEIAGAATGTSITLTNSADGYLQGITIKGHSEVVEGAIKSIGDAGWGVVDLGTLNWEYTPTASTPYFSTEGIKNDITKPETWYSNINNRLCALYKTDKSWGTAFSNSNNDMYICVGGDGKIGISNFAYTDATVFKAAMSGVLLYYSLADATGATPTLGITSKNGAGQGTAATITTGLPLRSVSDSIFDTLDNEKVIKKCGSVKGRNLTWQMISNRDNQFAAQISDKKVGVGSNSIICSDYVTSNSEAQADKSIWAEYAYHNNDIVIHDSSYSDATTFAAAIADMEIIYPLATPTETPLTPTEKTVLASLRTYNPNTQIDVTDSPSMTVNYLLNTDNGQAVAKVDSKIPQVIDRSVTLAYFRWDGNSAPYTQTLYVPGVLASDKLMLDVSISNNIAAGISQKEQWAYITKVTPSNDHITFSCYESRPTIDLSVNIRVVR